MYADAVHFKADMFGLDLTELRLMRWQVKRVDGGHKYAVTIVDWHGVAHDFQLHKLSGELYDRLVRTWHLDEMVTRKSSATNPHVQDPNDPNSKTGREAAEALARHKALIEARSKTAHGRLMRRIRPALREGRRACRLARGAYVETRDFLFPPPLPPPPPLPTVDVREKTSKCLFLSIVAADDLLAMDSGGVSDPFAVARWGALECKTEVVYKTVAPVWNETFVFHLGACPDIVDEDITLCLYDYDLALNDFLGFVRVPVKGKRLSDAKVWSPEPNWYAVEALPEGLRRLRGVRLGSTEGPDDVLGGKTTVHRSREDRDVDRRADRPHDAHRATPGDVETVRSPAGSTPRFTSSRSPPRCTCVSRTRHPPHGRQPRRPGGALRSVLRGDIGTREDAEDGDGADALHRRRGRAGVGA